MGVKGIRLKSLSWCAGFFLGINKLRGGQSAQHERESERICSCFVPVENPVERFGGAFHGKGARRPVSRVLSAPRMLALPRGWTAIPLRRASLRACRDQPGRQGGNAPASRRVGCCHPPAAAGHPYSVLLPVGFTLPPPLPGARCALAAPFHPCPPRCWTGTGGLFSVALSLGSPPPAVNRHRVPVEPGLSSTPERTPGQRPSSRLATV